MWRRNSIGRTNKARSIATMRICNLDSSVCRNSSLTRSQVAQAFASANAANAMAAAAVRFFTSGLHRMCSTCLQIVPVHALRITAISQFVFPVRPIKTSVRAVRPNEPSGLCSALADSLSSFVFFFGKLSCRHRFSPSRSPCDQHPVRTNGSNYSRS